MKRWRSRHTCEGRTDDDTGEELARKYEELAELLADANLHNEKSGKSLERKAVTAV